MFCFFKIKLKERIVFIQKDLLKKFSKQLTIIFLSSATIIVSSPILAKSVNAKPYYLEEVRTINGENNNLIIPHLGSVDTQLLRAVPADYADEISIPSGSDRPNPRVISNLLVEQTESTPNAYQASSMVFQWGQFLDHDIDLTEPSEPKEDFAIVMPGDPYFPQGTYLPFSRSSYDHDTGLGIGNPREQINQISSFIDASNVYGSDEVRASFLRRNDGTGRLKTSKRKMLPYNTAGLANAGGHGANLFVAGDIRANEQIALTTLHTVFVREHNRLAKRLRQKNRHWSGETIYQAARAYVAAQMQVITYKEFLPLLIGGLDTDYTGYQETVDPSIRNEFSTAAYRFGHTMIPSTLLRLNKKGKTIKAGNISLGESFFNPALLERGTGTGLEPILRGLVKQKAESIDIHLVDEIRNLLFGPPGAGGLDLASLNIQRGRDHGLGDYNSVREAYGLQKITDFNQMAINQSHIDKLVSMYASVDDVDLWVGGLIEPHQPGAMVGELLQVVLREQFTRLRDGDRFWYQNIFTGKELAELEATTLKDIIVRNTRIKSNEIGNSAFLVE